MLLCVNQAKVSTEIPRNSCPVTYVLQFALTLPEGPNSCMDVSMSVVSQSTNKMNEPRRMTPGISSRRPARMRMMRRKINVKPEVTTPNGKSHGVPTSSWFCTVINHANIPSTVDAAARMTKIQMLSCTSGQRYFRRVSRYTVSVAILAFATLRRVSLGSNYRCWSDIQRKLVMVDLCLANIHRCDCSRDMCYEAIAASDGSAMSFVELRSVLYLRWCAPSLRDVLELQCCSNDLSSPCTLR